MDKIWDELLTSPTGLRTNILWPIDDCDEEICQSSFRSSLQYGFADFLNEIFRAKNSKKSRKSLD